MDVLFQPNLNYSIDLYSNGRNEYCATKTIAEIIEMCNNLTPCDSIIIHKKSGANGYSAIVPLKIGTRTTYYVGSNALYDISDKQVILWENISGIYDGYYYAYNNNHDFIKYASASFSTQTIDDIEYCYDYDNRDDDYPPIMYITSNVEHLLINDTHKAGGAGSGYIGNSLLSNKKMVGFNVPTSSSADTKTESVSQASATPMPNVPKIGNGFARIKFLREYDPIPEEYTYIKIVSTHKIGDAEQNWNLDSMPIYIGNDEIQFSTNDYCVMVAGNGPTVISNYITSGNYQNIGLYAKGRIDLDKVSGGDNYTLSFSGFTDIKPLNSYNHYYSMFPNTNADPNRFQFYSGSNNDTIWSSFTTSFNNLGSALQYIYQHFRGVLLYVDGERWL